MESKSFPSNFDIAGRYAKHREQYDLRYGERGKESCCSLTKGRCSLKEINCSMTCSNYVLTKFQCVLTKCKYVLTELHSLLTKCRCLLTPLGLYMCQTLLFDKKQLMS